MSIERPKEGLYLNQYAYRRKDRKKDFMPIEEKESKDSFSKEMTETRKFKNPFSSFHIGMEEILIIGLIIVLLAEEEKDILLIISLAYLLFF